MNANKNTHFAGRDIGYSEMAAGIALAEKSKADAAAFNVPQMGKTLLGDMSQRLAHIHEILSSGNDRMERLADRVFGGESVGGVGIDRANDTASHTIDALLNDLIVCVEVQAKRMHSIANRIERIA